MTPMAPASEAPNIGKAQTTPRSSATAEDLAALDTLRPLLHHDPAAADAFHGRPYEYVGRRRHDLEVTTDDLEGLELDDTVETDPRQVAMRITPARIAQLVDTAILQSAPERALSELEGSGACLIHAPPPPTTRLRVPALQLRSLIEAVDADARRLASAPDQRLFRSAALLATDPQGCPLNRESARQIAAEAAELLALERQPSLDVAAQRRREMLARDHSRRCRYARAVALAARELARERPVDLATLYRAFDAVAGLDKAPFRRGPSEHLTTTFLAEMAAEFYRGLIDRRHRVTFVLLTFPIKNSSGLRTNVPTEAADVGELLMLAQLRRLLEFLAALGLPNVRFICLTDGIVYSRYLGPYDRLQAVYYRENVRHFRNALGLAGRVIIVDADPILRRVPEFESLLAHAHATLGEAEHIYPTVQRKLLSLTRSFLFHIHASDADTALLARIVNASLQGQALPDRQDSLEQERIWRKAAGDARWYAAHLVAMAALDGVTRFVRGRILRATVHPKPGQYAPAPVNVRDFNDLPYHRKPLLKAGANALNLDAYIGANLWADPHRRFVDVYVGQNRSPFLAVQL